MALTTVGNSSKNESIRVAVRVRPLLPHELHRQEVVYYPPKSDQQPLEVLNTFHLIFKGIKVADGQHLVESMYDRVFTQYSQ